MRPYVGVEGAHVLPVAGGDRAEQRTLFFEELGEDLAGEVDGATGGDVVEDLRFEDEDAGVDGVGEHLAPRRLLQKAFDRAILVGDDDAELEGVIDRGQPDGGERLLGVMRGDDRAEVDVGEHVAGDDEEAFLQFVHGVADAARRTQRGLLGGVDHAHPELAAVPEVGADRVGEIGDGYDNLVDAMLAQQVDDVFHHRPVGQRNHRLGQVGGQGAQA